MTDHDPNAGATLLPPDYSPGPHDVIIGRGKRCYNHRGNERFRELVQSSLEEYTEAKTKTHKSQIISTIVQHIRDRSANGFVKQVEGQWYAVEDTSARITTSQAFRDALSDQYKSSRQFKQKKRRLELEGLPRNHPKKKRNQPEYTLQDLYTTTDMPELVVPPLVITRRTTIVSDASSDEEQDGRAVKGVFDLLVDRFLPLNIDPLDDPFEPVRITNDQEDDLADQEEDISEVADVDPEPMDPFTKGSIPLEYLQFFLEPTPLSDDCCASPHYKSSAPIDYSAAFGARSIPSRNAPTARTA